MGDRRCKNCPVPNCGSKYLVKLSNHLAQVHELSPNERKQYLQEAKLQQYRVIREYNEKTCDWVIPSENVLYKVNEK